MAQQMRMRMYGIELDLAHLRHMRPCTHIHVHTFMSHCLNELARRRRDLREHIRAVAPVSRHLEELARPAVRLYELRRPGRSYPGSAFLAMLVAVVGHSFFC